MNAARRGIIIANTGSPDAPEPEALRRYLTAFLSDPRICPMHPLVWKAILHAFILPRRSRASAEKYQRIWTPAGSPLTVGMASLAQKLQAHLDARGTGEVVRYAMSYGSPSIESALRELKERGCTEVLVIPLYPQSAHSTTAVVLDKTHDALDELAWAPELAVVRSYSDHPRYRAAIADSIRASGFDARAGDRLLFAFHSIPHADIAAGDTYGEQAHATARAVTDALGLAPHEWDIGFQCRFDKSRRWLGPFMPTVLDGMAELSGSLFVVAPNFALDCLETLYDIDMVLRDAWNERVGCSGANSPHALHVVPCLNDSDAHVRLLLQIVAEQTRSATAALS